MWTRQSIYQWKKTAKPGDEVEIGDIIEMNFGNSTMKVEVLEVLDNVKKRRCNKII